LKRILGVKRLLNLVLRFPDFMLAGCSKANDDMLEKALSFAQRFGNEDIEVFIEKKQKMK